MAANYGSRDDEIWSLIKTDRFNKFGGNLKLNGLNVGHATMQGMRPKNEDHLTIDTLAPHLPNWTFLGIYDGHGGEEVSKKMKSDLHEALKHDSLVKEGAHEIDKDFTAGSQKITKGLKRVFVNMDFNCKSYEDCGTTVSVVLIGPKYLVSAHCGDSRFVLIDKENQPIFATTDHDGVLNPGEKKRVEENGGHIDAAGYVMGQVAPTRTIGDHSCKKLPNRTLAMQPITALPEVHYIEREESHKCLILACDGIWCVWSNPLCSRFLCSRLEVHGDPFKAASEISDLCLFRQSDDNMTVVVAELPGWENRVFNQEAISVEKQINEAIRKVATLARGVVAKGQTPHFNNLLRESGRQVSTNPPGGLISKKMFLITEILRVTQSLT